MLKPDFDFDYWGLPIYNLMGAIGMFFALIIFLRRERGLKIPAKTEDKLNLAMIAAGALWVIPANMSNWIFKPELLDLPLLQRISSAGLVFYYGMFGFYAIFALMLKLQNLDVRFWMDEMTPSVLIFHAFGRIGCALAGCCYGIKTPFPARVLGFRLSMFPAREIEAVCLFALFFVFSFKLRKNRFRLYLLCYSVLRFFLEFGRGDYRGAFLIHSLSPAQVTSVIVWIFLLVSATAPKWKGRENSGNCQG